jgi:hypothetical protein
LRLGFANQPNRQRGDKKGKCIEQYRDRCREQLNQDSGETRSGYLGYRAAEREFAIALEYLVALDKGGQIGLIGNVEEYGEDSRYRHNGVNLLHSQNSEHRGKWDRAQNGCSAEVGDDEDGPASSAIHAQSSRQTENQGCEASDSRKHAHLERTGVQN